MKIYRRKMVYGCVTYSLALYKTHINTATLFPKESKNRYDIL